MKPSSMWHSLHRRPIPPPAHLSAGTERANLAYVVQGRRRCYLLGRLLQSTRSDLPRCVAKRRNQGQHMSPGADRGDTHQRQSSSRCLRNYDRIRPIMMASGSDSPAYRCLRRPGGGCRTQLSNGSRLEALRSDIDSSAPSACEVSSNRFSSRPRPTAR